MSFLDETHRPEHVDMDPEIREQIVEMTNKQAEKFLRKAVKQWIKSDMPTTNDHFENLLAHMMVGYLGKVVQNLPEDMQEDATHSLFMTCFGIIAPMLNRERAHAEMDDCIDRWEEFAKEQHDETD